MNINMNTVLQDILDTHKNKVFYFSIPNCKNCDNLADEMCSVGLIDVNKVVLDRPEDVRALVELTGEKRFPQLFIGSDNYIGTADKFLKLVMTNKLKDELNKIGIQYDCEF